MAEASILSSETISCVYPYCRESSIPVQSINLHLSRCRRKWRGPISECPYNNWHIVPKPEELYHEITCPDRSISKLVIEKAEIQDFNINVPKTSSFKEEPVCHKRCNKARFRPRNVDPRLQKKFDQLSLTSDQSKTRERNEFTDDNANLAEFSDSVDTSPKPRGNFRGNHSFFRHSKLSVFALPGLPAAASRSEFHSITPTVGFRSWSYPKSDIDKTKL